MNITKEDYNVVREISRMLALGTVSTAREAREKLGIKLSHFSRLAGLMSLMMLFTGAAYSFRTVAG